MLVQVLFDSLDQFLLGFENTPAKLILCDIPKEAFDHIHP